MAAIAIAMNGDLVARLVQGQDLVEQLVARDGGITAVVRVAMIGRVVGLR